MTPERLAFIEGKPTLQDNLSGTNDNAARSDVSAKQRPKPKAAESKDSAEDAVFSTALTAPDAKRPRRRRTKRADVAAQQTQVPGLSLDTLLVPLTTRLQARTAAALREAYLRQKLDGRKPETKQEIVESAVQHWLRDAGYLK
jgi:hypothetical protein